MKKGSWLFMAILFISFSSSPAARTKATDSTCTKPSSWKHPPPSNRMIAWWMWYGPAVTEVEIHRELLAMHEAGLGGVLIYPSYPQHVDDPNLGIRNLRFLSPEYLRVYRDAVRFAHRLGMTVDVVGGSGWPFGGPSVNINEASHSVRIVKVQAVQNGAIKTPEITSDEKMVAAFVLEPTSQGATFHDVTARLFGSGNTPWLASHRKEVFFFINSPTRMRVKRPSFGGGGYVLNHLSSRALAHYEFSTLDKLTNGLTPGELRAIFTDSLEAYGSDWTDQITLEFRRQRGYDLIPNLPYLFLELGRRTEDVRFDFWETVSQLFVDDYAGPLQKWAHERGMQSEMQAYGVPAVPQRAYARMDLPGGEAYSWKEFTSGRWASSAAHFYAKNRVLAEYATWAGMPNRFTDTLDDLKLVADLQFLTGLTELGAATLPYSPPSVGIPGWQDYAGAAFGLNQTWWPFFHDLTSYVHRASFVLEQGSPVSDVLLYLPVEDVEASAPPGNLDTMSGVLDRLAALQKHIPSFGLSNALAYSAPVVSAILDNGYAFDGISGDILASRGVVKDRRLHVGEGSYALVVLPRITGMRFRALEKIADFVRAGGAVVAIGKLPGRVYGGTQPLRETKRLQSLVGKIFGGATANSPSKHKYGLGLGIYIKNERELPQELNRVLPPDFSLPKADPHIGFVHRRVRVPPPGDEDDYFVVNTGDDSKTLMASFRVDRRQPQLWDLEKGSSSVPADYLFQGDRTIVPLALLPHRSIVVHFGPSKAPSQILETNLPVPTVTGSEVSGVISSPGQFYVKERLGRVQKSVTSVPSATAVLGPWKVEFGLPLKTSSVFTRLKSWTDDPETKYFCGVGTYTTEVEVPKSLLGRDKLVWLDLGEIRDAARVWVNGHRAGDAWQAPFRLEIDHWLQPGTNHLQIEVANMLINCLLGQKPPDYAKLNAAYGDRFPRPEDWKVNPNPLPAGLLGPVRLVFGERIHFSLSSEGRSVANGLP
ncbi:MAG TPA: glycosyl hydrolase [Terriglobia bacterium]|nr:glycosyl hydrolase [Terriglobia bacterium]